MTRWGVKHASDVSVDLKDHVVGLDWVPQRNDIPDIL